MTEVKHAFFALVLSLVLAPVAVPCADANPPGKLYVVGMGPAGPDLTAPRALRLVEKADVLLCSPRMPQRFARFGMQIDATKVAFNPWKGIIGEEANVLKKANRDAWEAQARQQIQRVQAFVLEKIRQGKTVVMMDGGDPCVYGPSLQYLLRGMDEDLYEVVPGMGAFNAASAALKRNMIPEDVRFALLSSPQSLFGESGEEGDEILKDLSKYKTTMVLYMSLSSLGKLVGALEKCYPPDLPVAVVYYAGYADKERVLKSTLGRIEEDVRKMEEKWLGLVVVGECAG